MRPRVARERVGAIRREKADELFAFGSGEAGAAADVLQGTGSVVQAEQ